MQAGRADMSWPDDNGSTNPFASAGGNLVDSTSAAIAAADGSAPAADLTKEESRPVYMGSLSGYPISVTVTDKEPRGHFPGDTQTVDGDKSIRPSRYVKHTLGPTFYKRDDDVRTVAEVRGLVLAWHGTDKFTQWGKKLLDLGLIDAGDETSVEILDAVWQDAVDLAARFLSSGKKVTPWKAAELMAQSGDGGGGSRYGSSGGAFTGNRSSTSTSVDLTDPATAKAITNDSLSQALGRAARPEELSQFLQVINSAERANPTVTTSNTRYDKDRPVAESSTTSGGLTSAARSQMVTDQAQGMPEYGAYQAATVYFNSLVDALDSPV